MRRVAVTGIGAVSPFGAGVDTLWDAVSNGRSGIHDLHHFDSSEYSTRFGGYFDDFDPSAIVDVKEQRRMSRFQQFAVVAAHEALQDAGLAEIDDELAPRAGVIVGSGIGGLEAMEQQVGVLRDRGPSRVSPFIVPLMIVDLAAGHISIRYNLKGINYAPVSACATGNHALGEAFEAIRRDDADVIVAGGFDAGITELGLAGFCALRALSTRNDDPQAASRPFDMGRDGFVMGEGGGVLVLEELEHARARGARIYAEMLGYGATADAYHMTAPAPDGHGAQRAMRLALDKSGLGAADIGYINAHGTSTEQGDIAETNAIKSVFGGDAPPVSSTKSMTGHLLGGAGALEAAICVLAMDRALLPPTINLVDPDPQCDLDYVPNVARATRVDAVLSNAFGFGGHNASVLFARV
jgi:3-oxoacyl-[acyl-carrier-protein] synthase II